MILNDQLKYITISKEKIGMHAFLHSYELQLFPAHNIASLGKGKATHCFNYNYIIHTNTSDTIY